MGEHNLGPFNHIDDSSSVTSDKAQATSDSPQVTSNEVHRVVDPANPGKVLTDAEEWEVFKRERDAKSKAGGLTEKQILASPTGLGLDAIKRLPRSDFHGVYLMSIYKSAATGLRWRAEVTCFGKAYHLGVFKDATEAAEAVDNAKYYLYKKQFIMSLRLMNYGADYLDAPPPMFQSTADLITKLTLERQIKATI